MTFFQTNPSLPPRKPARGSRAVGNAGEEIAERYLARQGLTIIDRNVRMRMGEIDLVADDHGTLVFVEVKTMRSDEFGPSEGWVGRRKQARLTRLATAYLVWKGIHDRDCRIDVVGVHLARPDDQVVHIRNAFGL